MNPKTCIRIRLRQIQIISTKELFFNPTEIAFTARIEHKSVKGETKVDIHRLPEKGFFNAQKEEVIPLQKILFEGPIDEEDKFEISITGAEQDWGFKQEYQPYKREFSAASPDFIGSFHPGDEKVDPELLKDWKVWIEIEDVSVVYNNPGWGMAIGTQRFQKDRLNLSGSFDSRNLIQARQQKNFRQGAEFHHAEPQLIIPKSVEARAILGVEDKEIVPLKTSKEVLGGKIMGYTGRCVEVPDNSFKTSSAVIQIGLSSEELSGLNPETLRIFRWAEEVKNYELVPYSKLSSSGDYVWGTIYEPGIYAVFGLPADRARRDSLRLYQIMKPWMRAAAVTSVSIPGMIDKICTQILCEQFMGLYEKPEVLDALGLSDNLGRDLEERGLPLRDNKGRPHGRGPLIRPRPDGAFPPPSGMGSICDDCIGGFGPLPDPGEVVNPETDNEIPPVVIIREDDCNKWRPAGPSNYSGRVRMILFNPANPNVIYVANSQGGVYRSNNNGQSWSAMMHHELSLEIGALALAPSDPDILYAGTGEFEWYGSGVGIYKSINSGQNWLLTNGALNGSYTRIVVAPNDPNLVYAAGDVCVERSFDGGDSWELVLNGPVTDLMWDPEDPNKLFVGFQDSRGLQRIEDIFADPAVMLVTNFTGNLPLVAIDSDNPRDQNFIRLAHTIDANNSVHLFCNINGYSASGKFIARTFKFNFETNQWRDLKLPQTETYRAWCSLLGVEPGNPDVIYAGGVDLYWTYDGGENWHYVDRGHADNHHIAFDPRNPKRTLIGNDGGVWACTREVDAQGQPLVNRLKYIEHNYFHDTIQFENITVSQYGKLGVGGATQDQGVLYNNVGKTWHPIGGAEWGEIQVFPRNGKIIMWDPKWHFTPMLLRSEDGGETNRPADNGLVGRYLTRLAFHPENDLEVLVGTPAQTIKGYSFVLVPNEAADQIGDFTIQFRFQNDGSDESFALISGANADDENALLLFVKKNEVETLLKNKKKVYSNTLDVHDGSWHTIVWIREGAEERLYIDNQEVGKKTVATDLIQIDPKGLLIGQKQDRLFGGFDPNQAFKGHIDQFLLYRKALTTAQLTNIENSNDVNGNNLEVRYRFNNNLNDSSGNNHHGQGYQVSFTQLNQDTVATFGLSRAVSSTLFVTETGGAQFPATGFEFLQSFNSDIVDIVYAPSNSDIIYVLLENGELFKSTQGGRGPFNASGIAPFSIKGRLTVSWNNPDQLYICYGRYNLFQSHVYRNDEGGQGNWIDVGGIQSSSAVPDIPCHKLIIDIRYPSRLYLATDIGVFRSLDKGASWYPFDEGLPNAVVTGMEYRVVDQELWLSTFGRGAYRRSIL